MGPVNRDSVMVESPFESFEQSKFGRAEPPSLAARALNNKWRVGLLLAFPALVITAVAAAGVSSSGHGGNALCAPTCFEEGTHDSDGDGYHEAHCDDDCNDEQQATVQQCNDAGLDDADMSQYRYALRLPNKYDMPESDRVWAPIFTSKSMSTDTPDTDITHAMIWAHGLAANADGYFCSGYTAAKTGGAPEGTVLSIAPWFSNVRITKAQWTGDSDDEGSMANWEASDHDASWIKGGSTQNQWTTAFDMLDAVVNKLADLKQSGRFPNLERVTLAGFSAGAQLLNRWSFFSPTSFNGITPRILISNGGSYLYTDGRRPAESCSPGRNTGIHHTCDSFVTPGGDDLPKTCNGSYNNYKMGLDNLNDVHSKYLQPFAHDSDKIDRAKTAFFNKDIRYILGTEDVCQCNVEGYDNPTDLCYPQGTSCEPNQFGGTHDGISCCDTYPDTGSDNVLTHGCNVQLMGNSRLQRGLNYMSFLKDADPAGEGSPFGFFHGGHNNSAFYAAQTFKDWAYFD